MAKVLAQALALFQPHWDQYLEGSAVVAPCNALRVVTLGQNGMHLHCERHVFDVGRVRVSVLRGDIRKVPVGVIGVRARFVHYLLVGGDKKICITFEYHAYKADLACPPFAKAQD